MTATFTALDFSVNTQHLPDRRQDGTGSSSVPNPPNMAQVLQPRRCHSRGSAGVTECHPSVTSFWCLSTPAFTQLKKGHPQHQGECRLGRGRGPGETPRRQVTTDPVSPLPGPSERSSQTTALCTSRVSRSSLCLCLEEHDVTQPSGAPLTDRCLPGGSPRPGPCFPHPPRTSGPEPPALPRPANAPADQNSPSCVVTALTLQLKA